MKPSSQTKDVIARTRHIASVINELASSANDHTPEGKLALGKTYEFNRNFYDAIKTYQSIDSNSANYLEARARLAITTQKTGQWDQALVISQELAQQNNKLCFFSLTTNDAVSIHSVVADALSALGRDDDAIEAYTRGLKLEPNDFHAAAMAARLTLKQGRPEVAANFAAKIPPNIQRYNEIISLVNLANADPFQVPMIKTTIARRMFDGI